MQPKMIWRIFTAVALLVYVALVSIIVWWLAHSLGFAIVLGITFLLLFYAGWMYMLGDSKTARAGRGLLLIAVFSVTAELVYFFEDQRNRRAFLVIAGLTLFYLALFSILRRSYWLQRRKLAELSGHTAQFKKPYLIINPKSGDGRAVKAEIPKLAREQGITVLVTKKSDKVEDLALKAVKAGADVLGVSGGDGSIGAVAKVALEHKLPIIVLPGGTRCHLARDLGLDPKLIVDSLTAFKGVERRIDCGDINGRIFLNNASFGLYADLVDNPDYREHKLDVTRQVLGSLARGEKGLYDLRFVRKQQRFDKAVQVLVAVNQYNTYNLLELGSRPKLNEGILQVIALTKLDAGLIGRLLRDLTMAQLGDKSIPGMHLWKDTSFRVSGKGKKLVVGVDGEREEYLTPVVIKVRPGALRVFVPAEGERSRQVNPLSFAGIRRGWQAVRGGA